MNAPADVVTRMLRVPAMPRVVRDGVFDAWSWCSSDTLEWQCPRVHAGPLAHATFTITGENPPNLAFVMKRECAFLPRELARLHAFGYGLTDELALAPYAIDDATDVLYEQRLPPRDVFWLAASSLDALLWGLHDWVHFHNHGPFEEPAMTELQCDLIALAWLRLNAGEIGLSKAVLEDAARGLAELSAQRFREEAVPAPVDDLTALFLGPYPERLG
jgi:hypothetical protein